MRNPLQNLPECQITRLDSCDSTNQQLLHAADTGAPAGSVFVTREQTAGRGRRGREWVAAPGQTLAFSLLWTFPADPMRLSGLSLVVGLAVVRALSELAAQAPTQVRLGLKWPNDLLLERADGTYAKAGGILIESTLRSAPEGRKELAAVIGVGLNCGDINRIAQAVADQSIGSLSELMVNGTSPDTVLPVVLDRLFADLDVFARAGFAPSLDAWNRNNLWQGQLVQIREGNQILHEGVCEGVDIEGALCLRTSEGMERIISGDVSLRKV